MEKPLTNDQCANIWAHLTQELKNYCQQFGFEGVTFGLSGGMDSALVAALAIDSLGAENVHCYMLETIHTSELSKDLAQDLCLLNQVAYQQLNIMDIYTQVVQTLPPISHGLTLENLQARIRGLVIMSMSNDNPWLALCCGNKSEASVGYCTLYGDTVGGLCPIGDLYKTEVYQLAHWRNQQGLIIPEGILTRVPSAELAANQKDEDSLPPYPVLDVVLKQLIEEKKAHEKISGAETKVIDWVVKQYYKTAYKRQQMPPAISIRQFI